jgi:uncharacterized protein
MLTIGSTDKLHVREHYFSFGCNLRVLYISDLHFSRWARHILVQVLDICEEISPDVILLGGDMVDHSTGIRLLTEFVQSQTCPVYAIHGNHDELVGLDKVQDCITSSGGHWLNKPIPIHRNLTISGIPEKTDAPYSILCTHDPAIFPDAVQAGYTLTLAGHLHGGQVIVKKYNNRFYPGAFAYQWNGELFKSGNTTLIVSKGVHDTIPIRWNCQREVILCYC